MKMKRPAWVAAAATVLVLSCAKQAPDSGMALSEVMETQEFRDACAALPTCAQPRFQSAGPNETIWRVQVVREESGSIRFGRIDSVEVTEGRGVPMGPVTGGYLLAGVDESGTPVDGQMIQFPTAARIEFADERAPPELVDLSGKRVSTIGYVRGLAAVESLAIFDESAKAIATADVPTTRASLWNHLPALLGFPAPAMAQPIVNTSSCSHVQILSAGDFTLVENPLGVEQLVTPQPKQLANILAALGRMTPLLCQGVSTIAFGGFGSRTLGMVNTFLLGDIMMVNSRVYTEQVLASPKPDERFRGMDLQQTVLHEAGHAAEALLNSEGLGLDAIMADGNWPPIARVIALEMLERVRLKSGFGDEWSRVHDSFVNLGWATDYVDTENAFNLNPTEVAHSGFMSPYGASGHADDIAEAIGWTYVGSDYARAGVADRRRDYGCIQMMLHTQKDLPADLAAIYTKLHFLQDMGLVDPDDVKDCTGVNIGLPISTQGFEIWEGGVKKRNFDSAVQAGIGTKALSRAKVFTMKAQGIVGFSDASYPATLELHLDLESALAPIEFTPWPRGVYRFGSFWDANNLMVRVDGAAAGNWDAEDGFAIVTEASNDRIVGSVFLTRALRVSAPSPLPAYDTFDPPLIIRFLMEK
jgi:hypothetical protein